MPHAPKPGKTRLIHGVGRETISLGLLMGLMRFNEEDDVYELTPVGDAWLRQWCEQKLAEVESAE